MRHEPSEEDCGAIRLHPFRPEWRGDSLMDGAFPFLGHAAPVDGGRSDFPLRARLFMAVIALVTGIIAAPQLVELRADSPDWGVFLALAAGASLAQLFVVTTTRNQVYHTTAIFFVAGALLLPPEFVALLALVSHIPDWLKTRYPWYIQTFNILNFTLALMATWGAAHLVVTHQPIGHAR